MRAGVFEVPSAPNSDLLTFNDRPGSVVEFEERHTIFDQPGKLRLGAVRQSAATPATTARRWRSKTPTPRSTSTT